MFPPKKIGDRRAKRAASLGGAGPASPADPADRRRIFEAILPGRLARSLQREGDYAGRDLRGEGPKSLTQATALAFEDEAPVRTSAFSRRLDAIGLSALLGDGFIHSPDPIGDSADLPTVPKVLDDVARLSRTLEPHELPETQAALREVFERLEVGLSKLNEEAGAVPCEFRILENQWHQANAFVARARDPETHQVKNLVFVTTDLLASMMSDDGAENAILRLAGVLAHELAHPLDDLDSTSMSSKWGDMRSSQGREIRADLEAIEILVHAGFPPDSLYRALVTMDPGGDRSRAAMFGAVISGLNTHPERTVRQSAQRLYLTLRNYELGDSAEVRPLSSKLTGVAAEIAAHRPADPHGLAQYRGADLDRLLGELEKAPENDPKRMVDLAGTNNVRFNFLMSRLAEQIAPGGANVSDRQLSRAVQLLVRYADTGDRYGVLYCRRFSELQKKHVGERPPHEVLRGAPLLREPRFDRMLQPAFESVFDDATRALEGAHPVDLQRRHQALVEQLAETVGPEFLRKASFDPVMEAMVRSSIPESEERNMLVRPFDHLSPALRLRGARLFWEKVLPSYPAAQRLDVGLADYLNRWDANTALAAQRSEENLPYDLQYLREPHAAGAREDFRALLADYWKDRGALAVREIVGVYGNTYPWDQVFSELGIPREEGIRSLRESIVAYCKTPDFARLAKALEKRGYGFEQDMHEARLIYADASLLPALSGELNPHLGGSTRAYTARFFRGKLLSKDLELAREALRPLLRERLARMPSTTKDVDLRAIHTQMVEALYGQTKGVGSSYQPDLTLPKPMHDLWIEELLAAPHLSELTKSMTIRRFMLQEDMALVGYERGALAWTANTRYPEIPERTIALLFEHGIFRGPSDLLSSLQYERKEKSEGNAGLVFSTMTNLEKEVHRELDGLPLEYTDPVRRPLVRLAKALEPYEKVDYDKVPSSKNAAVRRIRSHLAEIVSKLPMPESHRLEYFDWLTRTGNTQETDALGLQLFRGRPSDPSWHRVFAKLLEEKRIGSPLVQLEIARELTEPLIGRGKINTPLVQEIADRIARFAPGSSQAKDDYLESLSWRLGLELDDHLDILEAAKSTNWRAQDPVIVNYASFISENVQDMEWTDRKELIHYLLTQDAPEFPASLEAALRRKAEADLAGDGQLTPEERALKVENRVSLARTNLERYAAELTPEGRIPVIEMILEASGGAIERDVELQREVLREFLGFEPDSTEERGLLAALRSMPDYERSVILAYQLSHSGSDKSSVRATAEAFKAVGKKVAQMSATFQFFDPEITAQLNEVKDNARPMTKREIRTALREGLAEEDYAKIKHIRRVLGSASMKTVVEVELYGGKVLAVGVQYPNNEAQVRLQLNRAQRYLAEASKDGIDIEAPLIRSLLEASRSQLEREMLMKTEAANIERSADFYQALNHEMRDTLGDWRFEVPRVSKELAATERVIATEFVSGVSFKKMPEGVEKERVGRAIAEASLRGLFREGWFDPDRHFGNALVDVENQRIHPLDFGQAEAFSRAASPWTADERYRFARILHAADAGDAAHAVDQALRFHDGARDLPEAERKALEARVVAAFAKSSEVEQRLTDLARAFADSGVRMDDKLLASGLKGLMTLSKDGYVGAEDFRALVKKEAGRLLAKKPIVWLREDPKGAMKSVFDAIRGR